MASSSTNPYPNYPYPSEFNVSDLVPDKLSKSNYSEWKPLMLDFIESRGMNEFIHHTVEDIEDFNDPKEDIEDPYFDDYNGMSWRKSDGLVRAWILSTLNKDIVKEVLPHKTAKKVWMKLETMFGSRNAQQPDSSSQMEAESRLYSYMPLHIDAIQGDVQNFIHRDRREIRKRISIEKETVLITAVRSVRRNELVKYLLDILSRRDLDRSDKLGRTALHEAAEVGNLEAAEMLVERRPSLLNRKDRKQQTPLLYAAKTGKREMVRFLLDRAGAERGFEETEPVPPTLLYHLANSGLYDIALELLQENSVLECIDTSMSTGSKTCPLMAMSQKRSSFRSGTPLSSFQKFIYSIVPAKLRNNATKHHANRENPQNLPQNLVVNENPHNDAVNPAINENRQNPPTVTDTENYVVDENPQYGAVTENPPIIENNLQNPVNIADSENPQITEDFVVSRDSDPQYGGTPSTPTSTWGAGNVFNVCMEEDPDRTLTGCPTYIRTNNDNLANGWNLVVGGIGRSLAILSHLAGEGRDLMNTIWAHLAGEVPDIKHIREIKLKHDEALELVKCLCKEIAKLDYSTVAWMFAPALAQATSSGIHEIVEEILRSYPDAIYFKNENNQSIFQSAIVWRRENVFNLIYQLKECSHKFLSVPDKFGNNALHLAGCLGPQQHLSVRVGAAGAALQMQRELQWFKEVEKFVLPQDKECRNNEEMTPAEVFTKTHKELVEAGERWMKDTATSCTIVAALIATVMFAAAITVPGGNNASSGVSIFSKQKAFVIFGLSDALALFASIASLLMFLSILTARYAEEDFLFTLPKRLICGLVYLFLSISSTMTAFGATVYLMMGENRPWIIYPIVGFGYIPVHLFVSLLFPLLVVMYKSTHRPAIFGKQSDHMLF